MTVALPHGAEGGADWRRICGFCCLNRSILTVTSTPSLRMAPSVVIMVDTAGSTDAAKSLEHSFAKMRPTLQALLLADHVYQDRSTNKMVVAGIFNRINLRPIATVIEPSKQAGAEGGIREIPLNQVISAGSPYAYLSMTDIWGEQAFELRFVALEDNQAIMGLQFKVQSNDRLATVEACFPLPPWQISKAGVYALELLHNSDLLGSLRITAEMGEQ